MRRTTRQEDVAFLKEAGVWFLMGVAVLQLLIICINVSRQEKGLPYWPADVGERALWTLAHKPMPSVHSARSPTSAGQ